MHFWDVVDGAKDHQDPLDDGCHCTMATRSAAGGLLDLSEFNPLAPELYLTLGDPPKAFEEPIRCDSRLVTCPVETAVLSIDERSCGLFRAVDVPNGYWEPPTASSPTSPIGRTLGLFWPGARGASSCSETSRM